MRIERGELTPGDSVQSVAEICRHWSCSTNSARSAIGLLKAQGLITTGRGRAPVVRVPHGHLIRSSEQHQADKDRALDPVHRRPWTGGQGTGRPGPAQGPLLTAAYDTVAADEGLAGIFRIPEGEHLLRRRFVSEDRRTGRLLSSRTSYVPVLLVAANPALLKEENEPWPGGTQHQLATVGIEIMHMLDQVTGRMPTTVEAQRWGLSPGVPLLLCRCVCRDADDRTVEMSDAEYPADRTELHFATRLSPWPAPPARAAHRRTDR